MNKKLTIVTGSCNRYFNSMKNLIGSLKYWAPDHLIVIYNLGLDNKQIHEIMSWKNVVIRWNT